MDPHLRRAAAIGKWWDENCEYVAGGAAIALGVALVCTGIGGPAGIAVMAGAGALMSGGVSVVSQKAQTGSVNWAQAGLDAGIGLVSGGAGGASVLALSRLAPLGTKATASRTSTAAKRRRGRLLVRVVVVPVQQVCRARLQMSGLTQ